MNCYPIASISLAFHCIANICVFLHADPSDCCAGLRGRFQGNGWVLWSYEGFVWVWSSGLRHICCWTLWIHLVWDHLTKRFIFVCSSFNSYSKKSQCKPTFAFLSHRYMSTLYSHPEFPTKGPEQINQELMKRVSSNPLRLLHPKHITNYVHALWSKKATGQPVTFTDIFGMLIGETLIPAVSIWSLGASSLCFCLYLQYKGFSFCSLNRGWTPSWVRCRKR